MATYITKRYPSLGFRTKMGMRYRFAVSVFDTEQIQDETLRKDAEEALERLANDPLSDSGVQREETVIHTSKFFSCDICGKQFKNDLAVQGHRRIHPTQEKIVEQTRAMGQSASE